MAKVRKIFACTNCGATSPKWMGKCSSCGEWNTYVEEVVVKESQTQAEKKKTWRKNDDKKPKLKPTHY